MFIFGFHMTSTNAHKYEKILFVLQQSPQGARSHNVYNIKSHKTVKTLL